MKYVLVRDDDLNYFTSMDMLNTVYGFMFEAGIPVNFSTIPAVNAAAKTFTHNDNKQDKSREVYEPFLPDNVAGTPGNFILADNQGLIDSLKQIKQNEYILHGYEHSGHLGLCEFEETNATLLKQKIDSGIEIFKDSFGKKPDTFVAPQDKYSFQTIQLIKEHFNTFSLGWVNRKRLPLSCQASYFKKKILKRNYLKYNNLLLTEHPGCHYSRFVPRHVSDLSLNQHFSNNQFTIIVTHHWEFFENGVLNIDMWRAFHSRIIELSQNPEVRLITFSELYRLV